MPSDSTSSEIIVELPRPLVREERLAKAINKIADPMFVPYLEEAWRCFNVGSYNGTIVWAWCAVMGYLYAIVDNTCKDIFSFHCGKKLDSLTDINSVLDDGFIQVCRKIKILDIDKNVQLSSWLNQFRRRRGELAHGKWQIPALAEEAVKYIEDTVEFFLQTSFKQHRLNLTTNDIRDLAMKYRDEFDITRIAELISFVTDPENIAENICHVLLDDCRKENPRNMRTLRDIWHTSYAQINKENQSKIIEHAIRVMADAQGLRTRCQDGVWIVKAILDEDNADLTALPVQYDGFWRLFRFYIWRRNDLSESEQNAFYAIIYAMLIDEITQRQNRDPFLKIGEDYMIAEYAPAQYQSMINQALNELRGGSHAKPFA